jgi:diphthine-ammonia ligase
MISSGLNAILIKIAGAGLTPSDLARPLSSMQPKLISLHRKFGTHPCGEGGEYETFTTDSPLFKSCIDIKSKEVVVVDQSDVAPVAYLRIKHALLIKKEVTPAPSLDIHVPPLLEHSFETLLRHVEKSLYGAASDSASGTNSLHPHAQPELGPSVRRIGPWIAVGNVRLPTSHSRPSSVGEEVTRCFEILQSAYRLVTVTLSPILSARPAGQTFTRTSGTPPIFSDHYAPPSRPRRTNVLFC